MFQHEMNVVQRFIDLDKLDYVGMVEFPEQRHLLQKGLLDTWVFRD
jgi:hypothetical protein